MRASSEPEATDTPRAGNRRLRWALVVSLLVHALLLRAASRPVVQRAPIVPSVSTSSVAVVVEVAPAVVPPASGVDGELARAEAARDAAGRVRRALAEEAAEALRASREADADPTADAHLRERLRAEADAWARRLRDAERALALANDRLERLREADARAAAQEQPAPDPATPVRPPERPERPPVWVRWVHAPDADAGAAPADPTTIGAVDASGIARRTEGSYARPGSAGSPGGARGGVTPDPDPRPATRPAAGAPPGVAVARAVTRDAPDVAAVAPPVDVRRRRHVDEVVAVEAIDPVEAIAAAPAIAPRPSSEAFPAAPADGLTAATRPSVASVGSDASAASAARDAQAARAAVAARPAVEGTADDDAGGDTDEPAVQVSAGSTTPSTDREDDAVSALRRELHLAARGTTSGSGRASVSVDGGPAVHAAPLDAETGDIPSVSAKDTPLGRYLAAIETLVIGRWIEATLPPEAMLATRPVVIAWRMHPSGEVDQRVLVQSSGTPSVDAVAIAAIPARVPRFPRNMPRQDVLQRVTLAVRLRSVGRPARDR